MINGMHYMESAYPHSSSLAAGGTCTDNVNSLTLLYFNARSLVPKYSELCAVVEAYNPDIVCIVESWLGDCIFDEEVAIPGYRTHRLDRNRHGGGIICLCS